MDDLYDDLENYNDVNAVEELRSENKELKIKLQEYADSLEKLQKDYDNLASEFKNLEVNYSSLLKTARAEIERKTHLITQLNLEKDMMVVNSIQNGKKHFFNTRQNNRQNDKKKENASKSVNDINKNIKSQKTLDSGPPKTLESKTESEEEGLLPSEDTTISNNTDNTIKDTRLSEYSGSQRDTEYKENIKQESKRCQEDSQGDIINKKPNSIKDRRKSMPVLSKHVKYSSDEESEGRYSTEINRKQLFSTDIAHREYFNRYYDDRQSNKMYEDSNVDDKYSRHHKSYKEKYKNRLSRQWGDNKHKHRGKYQPHLRHRRHASPEKYDTRRHRPHLEDNYYNSDHDKYRVLDSSPDRHYQHRSNERRLNYDRQHHLDYEQNRQEKYPVKHKIHSDFEGPQSKRSRIDMYNRCLEENRTRRPEKELIDEMTTKEMHTYLQYNSCQSPDYIQTEHPVSTYPIKEIRNTAATKLEDPRLTSKKYITKTEADKKILSTITGRNVEMKMIEKHRWKIEQVDVPAALLNSPSFSDDVVKEIYGDIDNPVTSFSDSGSNEFLSTDNGQIPVNIEQNFNMKETPTKDNENDPKLSCTNVDYNLEHASVKKSAADNAPLTSTVESCKYKEHETNIKEVDNVQAKHENMLTSTKRHTQQLSKYKIPKIKDSDNSVPLQSKDSLRTINLEKHSEVTTEINHRDKKEKDEQNIKDKEKRGDQETLDISDVKKCTSFTNVDNPSGVQCKEIQSVSDNNNKLSSSRISAPKPMTVENKKDDKKKNNERSTKSEEKIQFEDQNILTKQVIAGDLVLSDESEDNTELKIKIDTVTVKETISESSKTRKSKRRIQKQKESSHDTETPIAACSETEHIALKKTKSKKETKEMKTKFCDLFGDTSSLITPEDLETATAEVQTQPLVKCKHIVKDPDIQDVAALNSINVLKVHTRLSSKTTTKDVEIKETCTEAPATRSGKKKSKSNTADKGTEKKKKSKKNCDMASVATEGSSHSANADENLRHLVHIDNEPGVVKTVVISTGVQGQLVLDNPVEPFINQTASHTNNNKQAENDLVHRKEESIYALATSTPHKVLTPKIASDSKILDSCSSSSDSKVKCDQITESSNTVVSVPQQEVDEPDIRIFVKRRRKVLKKP